MTTREQAVSHHLQYNFHPSLPQDYVAPAIEALEWVRQGEFEVIVYLPANINPRPVSAKLHQDQLYITASDLVDSLKLTDYTYGEF
jgi:hypothetical protein